MKTESERIVKWNEDRLLIKNPEDLIIENEMSFIVEEVLEIMTAMKSEEARESARKIAKAIRLGNTKLLIKCIDDGDLDKVSSKEGDGQIEISRSQIADGCGDIKVFATGTIRKAGYNPDIVMDEVIKEIESRKGSIIDGKFVKDTSEKAKSEMYIADFTKAEIK